MYQLIDATLSVCRIFDKVQMRDPTTLQILFQGFAERNFLFGRKRWQWEPYKFGDADPAPIKKDFSTGRQLSLGVLSLMVDVYKAICREAGFHHFTDSDIRNDIAANVRENREFLRSEIEPILPALDVEALLIPFLPARDVEAVRRQLGFRFTPVCPERGIDGIDEEGRFLEVKDLRESLGVPLIRAFAQKIRTAGATQGVLVAWRFAEPAVREAAMEAEQGVRIELVTFAQLERGEFGR
jgi:hypothetical protein